jgi:hypothetical protein
MLDYICKRIRTAFALGLSALFLTGIAYAQIVFDFESGSLEGWEVVDEAPENLGDLGPSTWEIRDSQLGLDGKALYQGSNIWGSAGDAMLMGTFIIYDGQRFSNFILDVDVSAADNDAMGLAWAYEGADRHYRVMMINDRWPDPPLDGFNGPMLIAHKRISNAEPWYELVEVVKDGYTPYPEGGQRMHWTLEVMNGDFTFTRDDGLSISGTAADYADGYVGIQLYAQQAEFDNFTITPLDVTAVDAKGKLATAWGAIKAVR